METIHTVRAVMPPKQPPKRARSWDMFAQRFEPIEREDERMLWEPSEVPFGADYRYWWAVLEGGSGRLYLAAGFHFVDRLGYVRCAVPWGGKARNHPVYCY